MKLDELLPPDLFVSDGARSAATARVLGALQCAYADGRLQGLADAAACPVARHDGTLRALLSNLHAHMIGAPKRLAHR